MKKTSIIIGAILLVLVLSGTSAIFAERVLLPRLATTKIFSDSAWLKKVTENVTIVQKTENITVREDDSVATVASQSATSVVSIISLPVAQSIRRGQTPPAPQEGAGVILTSDGIIGTHKDAIIPTAVHKVLTFDGREHQAELLGIDPFTDLAFFKIEAQDVPSIALANSDDVIAGKKIVAIGRAAEDFNYRYTAGLLAHVNKPRNLNGGAVSSSEKVEGLFEIDFNNIAGFFGAPAIDFNGDMVGLVGRVSVDGVYEPVIIPANHVRDALNHLTANSNQFARPELGVFYVPLTKAGQLLRDLPRDRGALVFSPSGRQNLAVIAGSPAARAGVQVGDVIIKVDDQDIDLNHPLANVIAEKSAKDTVTLTVLRGERELTLQVQL